MVRASAAIIARIVPATAETAPRYGAIIVPTVIIAGSDDRIVDFSAQSRRVIAT